MENFLAFTGISYLGVALALGLSWRRNHSVLWLLLHGLMGWIYVIYFILSRSYLENKMQHRECKDQEFKEMVSDLVQKQKDSKDPK